MRTPGARVFSSLFPRLPKYLKTPFLVSLLITSVMTLTFLALFFSLQPEVPLFYSLSESKDFLASKEWLALLPFFSLVITVLHLFIVKQLMKYEKILQKLFLWTTVVWQVVLAVAFFRILWIIT